MNNGSGKKLFNPLPIFMHFLMHREKMLEGLLGGVPDMVVWTIDVENWYNIGTILVRCKEV